MRVHIARALLALLGVVVAGPALADEVVISDVLVSKREVTAQPAAAPGNPGVVRPPAPVSSYYAPPSDTRFFTMGAEIKAPAPDADSSGSQSQSEPQAAPVPAPLAADAQQTGTCPTCNACDDWCEAYCAACENCPHSGLVLFSGIDSWHGLADRGNSFTQSNNDGASMGFNYATRLGTFSELTGIAFQAGASYGVYDWNGRVNAAGTLTTTAAQQQEFVTLGFFKKANERSNLSYGILHDWMINQGWGSEAVNPVFGQWRGQVAYAVSACDELGVWGTLRDKGATSVDSIGTLTSNRSINQANAFWHHKWELGADSWFWVGLPQNSRLDPNFGGNLGDFLVGGNVIAPLNDYVALYGNFQYMHPSAHTGVIASSESAWNVSFGLQWYVGGTARTSTVGGNCWLPLMGVANNGSFLVDNYRR